MRWIAALALAFNLSAWSSALAEKTGAGPASVTIFLEAETGAPPAPAPPAKGAAKTPPVPDAWTALDLAGASGGKVLSFPPRFGSPESPGLALNIPRGGSYRVWLRYFKKTAATSGVFALFRDEAGEGLICGRVGRWLERVPTESPYQPDQGANAEKAGFVWESFTAIFDRPVATKLSFGGAGRTDRQIDCVLLTTDTALDPSALDVAALPALATVTPTSELAIPPAPAGMIWSQGLPGMADFFAGLDNRDQRFWAGLINNGSVFADGARMARMGFNRDHSGRGVFKWGIPSMVPVEGFNDPQFVKAHPAPEGRFVNAQGQVGTMFSLHYQPWVDAAGENLKQHVKEVLASDDGSLGFWRISAEEGGWLDYSPYAIDAFRQWLKEKHGTVQVLDSRWGTTYSSFDEITPPKTYEENHACWLEFREFSGHSYAVSVGRRIPIIKELDPKRRPCLGANSNLDIGSPYFMAFRPNDFEELIRVGLKDEKYVAFDIYCADDDMSSAIDFLTSIAQGRKLINQEFSNHVVDPRIAARTYWEQVAKGIHGIHLFMFQDNAGHPTYPKWALLSQDGSPKQKLAAYSDAAQEIHRLEPLLMSATYTHAVKPVAMYWSRIDLGLDQPQDSFYGHSLNMPLHIYRTLRSMGYPVRWITPRQIAEGELDQVGALVMAGINHVPQAAAAKLEAWVKDGGTVIADSWPGAFDEYGQPQATLAPIFGVRPAPPRVKGAKPGGASQIALQESKQGYGEVTDAAVVREKYFQKIDEMAQQPYATHPVALALGDFMLAGVCLENIQCFSGKIIGMTHRGYPGFVASDYGKGKALYSAFLLGTIYEAAPTRYEWDTTVAGLSYGRALDAFLKYAGVKAGSHVAGLTPRIAAKLRVESPLVTPQGNVLIGLTSMNDDVVKPFDLEVVLPSGKTWSFTSVLITTQGSRQIQKVAARVDGSTLKLRMPSFDTHAMILALQDAGPLVSLELKGVERGPASLAMIQPGQSIDIEAVVYNPSPRELPAGQVTLTIPAGWLQSAPSAATTAIAPGGEGRCSFTIRAPEAASPRRIDPLVARFETGKIKSTPASEMVWRGPGF